MIQITDKGKCCGCTACAQVCPKNCISMVRDEEGFLYPQVDTSRCVNCGLCEKVCQEITPVEKHEEYAGSGYVVRIKDHTVSGSSSSGGTFTAIAEAMLDQDGVVFGVRYGENNEVVHFAAEKKEEIALMRGSKYVQSNLKNSFADVKRLLQEGRAVCFSGTACQTAGLKKYLGKEYDDLLLVDLVCHGVPSPGLWKKYTELMEKRYHSKIRTANFRDKKYGYQMPSMKIEFENGKTYQATARVDIMLKSFFTHIGLRYSCYECPAKGVKRSSDITLFDCWNAGELIGQDDNKGYTAVIVQSEKGEKWIDKLQSSCEIHKVDLDRLIPANGGGMVVKCASRNPKRDKFYADINANGLEHAFRTYVGLSSKDKVVEFVKVTFGSKLSTLARYRRLIERKKKK